MIHVRGPDGWITVFWKHLDRAPLPFGELAWDHARRSLGREATEEQIADAVAALLRRANAGPEKPGETEDEQAGPPGGRPDEGGRPARDSRASPSRASRQSRHRRHSRPRTTPLAKVIPMKIFDPFAEADKRW